LALQPKPHIADIQPGTHGGINFCAPAFGEERIAAPFGLAMTGLKGTHPKTSLRGARRRRSNLSRRPEAVLDFSTCCNPYGPPPSVNEALAKADIALYPDHDCREFIGLLSSAIGAPQENLIATSGSTELLRLAALAYTGPGDTVVIPSPTYGEYELSCKIANAHVVKYEMKERAGFRLAAGAFISFARKFRPSAIFLCNPNNPTGRYLGLSDIVKIVSSFPDTLIVLDEAYVSFTADALDSLELLDYPNILIVRSMTKDFALAGLRLGYGIASKVIIDTLKKLRPPWNVNSAAQQAGLAALNSPHYMKKCNALINKGKNYLVSQLKSPGYEVLPTDTNFFLVRVGNASKFQRELLAKGFLVRDCSSFGLPAYIRIAPRRMQDCRSLIAAIKSTQSEVN
jgi:histidinol-phosphate aminotransferase